MLRNTMFGACGVLFVLSLATAAPAKSLGGAPSEIQYTKSDVHGTITAIQRGTVTITITTSAGGSEGITGRITDETEIFIDGRKAKASDLKVSYTAKGKIGLNDVWTFIRVESAKR
jgi:uncharacterized protein YjdB